MASCAWQPGAPKTAAIDRAPAETFTPPCRLAPRRDVLWTDRHSLRIDRARVDDHDLLARLNRARGKRRQHGALRYRRSQDVSQLSCLWLHPDRLNDLRPVSGAWRRQDDEYRIDQPIGTGDVCPLPGQGRDVRQ